MPRSVSRGSDGSYCHGAHLNCILIIKVITLSGYLNGIKEKETPWRAPINQGLFTHTNEYLRLLKPIRLAILVNPSRMIHIHVRKKQMGYGSRVNTPFFEFILEIDVIDVSCIYTEGAFSI